MNFKPLGTKVLVQPGEEEFVSDGGIIIPGIAQKKSTSGKVLAVGPGRTLNSGDFVKPEISVGDVVMFSNYGGQEITINNEKLILLNEEDVFGIVE